MRAGRLLTCAKSQQASGNHTLHQTHDETKLIQIYSTCPCLISPLCRALNTLKASNWCVCKLSNIHSNILQQICKLLIKGYWNSLITSDAHFNFFNIISCVLCTFFAAWVLQATTKQVCTNSHSSTAIRRRNTNWNCQKSFQTGLTP